MNSSERWLRNHVIGLSVSESDDLLGRGFGREHLREFLMRVTRPVLRAGADLAYGGHFKKDALTRDLIELISDEQREGTADSKPWIGILYNHSPWPYYADITEEDEADFIDACRFIPITQELAGIGDDAIVHNAAPLKPGEALRCNDALVLSAMRRFMSEGMSLERMGKPAEKIPYAYARILVGGKVQGFSGILPGLYEEALYCLENRRPLFILGGYGGASGKLAGYLQAKLDATEAMLDMEALRDSTPNLVTLEQLFEKSDLPKGARKPAQALADLVRELDRCRKNLSRGLSNGLSEDENKRLFASIDTTEAAALIVKGLHQCIERDNKAASRKKAAVKKKPTKKRTARKP